MTEILTTFGIGTFKDQDLNDRIYLPIEFRERVRPDIIRIARMGVVGKFQSCMASELWI